MKTNIENFQVLVPRHYFGSTAYVLVKLALVQTRPDLSIKEGNWLKIATSLLSSRRFLTEGQEVILTQEDCLLHLLTHTDTMTILEVQDGQ